MGLHSDLMLWRRRLSRVRGRLLLLRHLGLRRLGLRRLGLRRLSLRILLPLLLCRRSLGLLLPKLLIAREGDSSFLVLIGVGAGTVEDSVRVTPAERSETNVASASW